MSDQPSTAGELCGRLLAQLEQAQWEALGDTNRTLVDRYYAKASVNPEHVFPPLFRGAQAHLSKARRKGKGIYVDKRIGELVEQILVAGGLPQRLSMKEQADFALGYWHERQSRFARQTTEQATDDQPEEEGE